MDSLNLRDDLRAGSIRLSAIAALFRFTVAEMEQARAWIAKVPDLLIAGHLEGQAVDPDPADPLLALQSGMKLGQIVTEERDLLRKAQQSLS